MHKQLAIGLTLVSTSILTLNFDKELSDLKKTATAIGSDAWDRASFEENAFTARSNFFKCKEETRNSSGYSKKCDELFQEEIGKQLSKDGKNLLKLLIADIILSGAAKTVESATSVLVEKEKAKNIGEALFYLPRLALLVPSIALVLNTITCLIAKKS